MKWWRKSTRAPIWITSSFHTHARTHVRTYARARAYTHTSHTHTPTNTHTHTCTHTRARTHARTHAHTHTHIRTHAHTCAHTHTQSNLLPFRHPPREPHARRQRGRAAPYGGLAQVRLDKEAVLTPGGIETLRGVTWRDVA